jgi:GH24 family phage-related lysozyme (muramidase)
MLEAEFRKFDAPNPIDQYAYDLATREGVISYPYLDSVGLVTYGVGECCREPVKFLSVPWKSSTTGALATPEEVGAAWGLLKAEHDRILSVWGKSTAGAFKAYGAWHYHDKTLLRMAPGEAMQRCKNLLVSFVEELKKSFPGWDALPAECRRVLVDLAWNTGAVGFAKRWPKLVAAIAAGDYRLAASECHTDGESEERGTWRRQRMLSCVTP